MLPVSNSTQVDVGSNSDETRIGSMASAVPIAHAPPGVMVQVVAGGLGQKGELFSGGGLHVPFFKIGLYLALGMLDRSVISSLIHRAVDRDHHGFF